MKRMFTLAALTLAAGQALGAGGVLYKHSLDANNQFDRYDPGSNSWTQLTGYSSYNQMAVSGTDLFALNANTNMIQKYNPGSDTWSDVMAGPNNFHAYGNLERLNNGEFVIHSSYSGSIDYTVGGVWNSTNLGFQPDAMGSYDAASNRLIIGEYGSDRFHVVNAGNMTQVGQIGMGNFNGEYARGSTVLNGRFYTQYGSTNLLSIDIGSIAGPIDQGPGTSYGFYDSIAADQPGGLVYIASLDGSQLKVWDSGNNNVTNLAGGFNNGNHSSLSFIPVPAPGAAAMLGVGGLMAARRRR